MIEDLVKSQKLTHEQLELYQLFYVSSLGRKWLKRKILETFLEQPPPQEINGDNILFLDGRRSCFREIHAELEIIKKIIKEFYYERSQQSESIG